MDRIPTMPIDREPFSILIKVIVAWALLFGSLAFAMPDEGSPFPEMLVADKGVMVSHGSEISFTPFGTSNLRGKVSVLLLFSAKEQAYHLAAPFHKALVNEGFPTDKVSIYAVVGMDEIHWGAKGVALGIAKKQQRRYQRLTFVIDAAGSVRTALKANELDYAVLIVDRMGTIIKSKVGALSEKESIEFLRTIHDAL